MTPNTAVGTTGNGGGGSGGGGGGGGEGGLKKGPWTASEDAILMEYVRKNGEGNWNAVQRNSGLNRCGKSCRLRWANHLRPNLKKGAFSPEEERLILQLHAKYGNKWARMAAQVNSLFLPFTFFFFLNSRDTKDFGWWGAVTRKNRQRDKELLEYQG